MRVPSFPKRPGAVLLLGILACLLLGCAAPRDGESLEARAALPIGVFDSGTGGLTVLDALLAHDRHLNAGGRSGPDGVPDLAQECFIYYGDQANMPYGRYAAENNTALLVEHIEKDARFLLGTSYHRRAADLEAAGDKAPVKAIVIACNTATAYGRDAVAAVARESGREVPVIGVIGAGARAAARAFDVRAGGSIAVLATEGTVTSEGYPRAIAAALGELGAGEGVRVFQQAGLGLAGAIDGSHEYIDPHASAPREDYRGPAIGNPSAPIDPALMARYAFDESPGALLRSGAGTPAAALQLNSIENYIAYHLVSLMEQVRTAPDAPPLRAIILGCTHYPFYADVIREKLGALRDHRENGSFVYRPHMAPEIAIVDPAEATAEEVYRALGKRALLGRGERTRAEFFIGVPDPTNPEVELDPHGGFTYDYKYGRKPNRPRDDVKRVPMSRVTLLPAVIERLRQKLPRVFELLRVFNRDNPKTADLEPKERI